MKFKKIMIMLIIALFFISIAGVSAGDAEDAIAISEDAVAMEVAQSDEMTASDDSNAMEQSDDEELILEDNDVDEPMLGEGASTGSFTDLDYLINNQYSSNDTITLSCNYTFNGTDDDDSGFIHGISINRGVTIDGKGCTIDGSQKARIFNIGNSGTVKFLNINFINGKATGSGEEMNGGAIIAVYRNCVVVCCNFTNNTAEFQGGALLRVTAYNCTFTGNTASQGGAIAQCDAYNSIFTGNTANDEGGAICYGSVYNCVFTGNTAHNCGGAIYLGSAYNCTFTENTAMGDGGAMMGNQYNPEQYSATLCMFDSNHPNECSYIRIVKAVLSADNLTTSYKSGDRLLFNLTANNTNYTGFNTTIKIYQDKQEIGTYYALSGEGWIVDLSPGTYNAVLSLDKYEGVINGDATITITDGTTFWDLNQIINGNANDTITLDKDYAYNPDSDSAFVDGIVINRSVTINGNGSSIDAKGQAKIFHVQSANTVIENLTLKNANHNKYGGAIYFSSPGTVTNCTFTDNTARYGGAIYFNRPGTVTNCTFTDNNASYNGGAVYFLDTGNVTNCTFTDNTASNGGAVYFDGTGTVINCNFTGNNATFGSAIFFNSYGYAYTISNSIFLNNLANAESLEIIKNDNNITITFKGNDNLLNAIYSLDDVNFANVTYWGANGIANTDSSTPSRSENEAGQNITVGIVVNDKLVLDNVYVTDENGMIVLDISAGDNYYISVRHDADSYYTEAERTITNNTKFNVNVTSQTTTNKTVNITAKSNIPNDVVKGKLLFILPNSIQINATYAGDGIWWAEHAFEDYGVYQVNATYVGLDNVTVNNGTISISENKIETSISAADVSTTYNINRDLVIALKDSNGNALSGVSVTVDLNGAKTYTTDKNGQVKISTKGLAIKTYAVKITFAGNAKYAPSSKEVKITIKKAKPKIIAKKKTYRAKKKTKKFTITLKDNKGKPIKKVKVRLIVQKIKKTSKNKNKKSKKNKRKNIVKTNKKGKATFKINRYKKGKYLATVKFYGNKYYSKTVKKVKINLK